MKLYRICLVIGIIILFVVASVGASVVPKINSDKDKMNSVILNFENKPGQMNRAWSDNFDYYDTGQFLDGDEEDGGWFGWDNNPQFGAYVVDNLFFSEPHSVDIVGDSDLVHKFSGYTSGEWRFLAWQYVPSDFSGESYFILLSDYAEVDPETNSKWAVQIKFDSVTGMVESEFDDVTMPLITGQWVLLRTEINLDTDLFKFYYNGDLLIEKAWTAEPGGSGGGFLVIDAVDLFANGATSVYYDDLSLDIPQPLSCDANGPYEDIVNEEIEFEGTATGGIPPYQYLWDFGDDNTSDEQNPIHTYTSPGNYTITLTVTDYESDTSSDTTWASINGPPNAPIIDGSTTGTAGTSYEYGFTSTDPDGDNIAEYIVDWDDGTMVKIIRGPFTSGERATAKHTWDGEGEYVITAKAKDINGLVGPEGTLTITMPRNRKYTYRTFLNFLQSHLNLFPILQKILK